MDKKLNHAIMSRVIKLQNVRLIANYVRNLVRKLLFLSWLVFLAVLQLTFQSSFYYTKTSYVGLPVLCIYFYIAPGVAVCVCKQQW